ncbi:hypothetical protein ACQRBH_05865 [Bariatricus sp. SGI.161]|uniref:hypothetical protein n=1 Tax=Bariatricus sp. SGI.161 TaxID=3420550 RepID=UPI003D0324A3
MYYSCLSILDEIIDNNTIRKLTEYFISLTPNSRDLITVSKIANALKINDEVAVQIILKCEEEGILQRHFGIRCPNCGMLIKEMPTPDLDRISISECYCCDQEISISENDIVILFKLIKIEVPFDLGQQNGQSVRDQASIVAREDTFKAFQIMCETITKSSQEKRLEEYKNKIDKERKEKIHGKAIKKADRNRVINILVNIISIVIALIVIYSVYKRFGFEKLSLFVSFAAFIIPFGCNFIVKELFLTDVVRIEERLSIKYNER